MEQYIVWILLAGCVAMHFWMMRKMRHGVGHDGHGDSHEQGCCGHEEKGHDEKKESGAYTCPMHPEVKQDKPGSCPECGMNLTRTHHS